MDRLVNEIHAVTPALAGPAIRGLTRNTNQVPAKLFTFILAIFSDAIRQGVYGYIIQSGGSLWDQLAVLKANNILLPAPTTAETKPTISLRKRGSFIDLNDESSHQSHNSDASGDSMDGNITIDRQLLVILETSYFSSRFPLFCQLSVMKEISDLYDGIDVMFTTVSNRVPASTAPNPTVSSISAASNKSFQKGNVAISLGSFEVNAYIV